VKTDDGKLVAGARVSMVGGFQGKTNDDGEVSFSAAPGGRNEVSATIQFDGDKTRETCPVGDCEVLSKTIVVNVSEDAVAKATITLPAPVGVRAISINGRYTVKDFDIGNDEKSETHQNVTFKLKRSSDAARRGHKVISKCVDGEVLGRATFDAYLNDDLSADVTVKIEMEEGWGKEKCDHGNDHHERSSSVTVAKQSNKPISVEYKNDDGRVTFTGTVYNKVAP
jgi:hypothetical protein